MIDISVIIRTYNSANMVAKAIESALNQSLERIRYEIIVVDDGSSDATLRIVKEYGSKIRLIENSHVGPAKASNRGILESQGRYVILLDSDDELFFGTLQTMLGGFQKDSAADFVYSDYIEIKGNEENIVSTKENIFNTLACGILFKKSLFDEVGGYDANLVFGEYDLLLRLLNKQKIGKHLPTTLYRYYRTEGSLTFDKNRVEKGMRQLKEKYGNITENIRTY